MRILNIHGYHGDPHNCAYSSLTKLGHEVFSPAIDYDGTDHAEVLDMLTKAAGENEVQLVTATSLGGFYGALLSVSLGLRAVLINPCLLPFLHLPRLGFQGDIRPYIRCFDRIAGLDRDKVLAIVGSRDEVIDSHDFTKDLLGKERVRTVIGGKHSGATLPLEEFFSEVIGPAE